MDTSIKFATMTSRFSMNHGPASPAPVRCIVSDLPDLTDIASPNRCVSGRVSTRRVRRPLRSETCALPPSRSTDFAQDTFPDRSAHDGKRWRKRLMATRKGGREHDIGAAEPLPVSGSAVDAPLIRGLLFCLERVGGGKRFRAGGNRYRDIAIGRELRCFNLDLRV